MAKDQNPAVPQKKVRKKRIASKRKESFTVEEEERFFRACARSIRDTAIFKLMRYRGLRASEVGLLKLSDWKQREGRLEVTRLKGSYSYPFLLKPVEIKALRSWVRKRGSQPGPLFTTRQGSGPITRAMLWYLMQTYCKAAGIDPAKAHPHTWKHTCGTRLAEQGADALDIKGVLGHVAISSTMIYVDDSDVRQDNFAEKTKNWK